jgi:hypothetical protein
MQMRRTSLRLIGDTDITPLLDEALKVLQDGSLGKSYAPPVSGTEPRSARVGAMLGRPVNAAGAEFFCVFFFGFFVLLFSSVFSFSFLFLFFFLNSEHF